MESEDDIDDLVDDSIHSNRTGVSTQAWFGKPISASGFKSTKMVDVPSLQENAPMAIAEAMAAGVPVITSDVCGMPTMVNEGEAGFLVQPHDVDYIAQKVRLLLENSQLRDEMSHFVRQKAMSTYHPSSVVDATLALYRELTSGE